MVRVGILGATGYTGLELIKLLLRHPEVEITALTTRQEGRPHLAEVHPQLTGRLDLHLENLDSASLADKCDCVFSCLPHAASAESVRELLQYDLRVVDFSADYRLDDLAEYERWYETRHPDPERVGSTPYGLPEFFRDQISSARLVANPGCYPTSAILAMGPLIREGLVEPADLIIDSKSGVSGAGRTPKLTTHFPECNESLSAYNIGRHRHTPEIRQVLSTVSGQDVSVIFTPHLIPMDRGILTTAYGRRRAAANAHEPHAVLKEAYRDCPFVQVVDHLPSTKETAHSNFCHLSTRIVEDRVIVVSCIDNLIKGASGAAVQNMNLMYGIPETLGLL